ncbi:peptidase inhibitor family I36 protein [Streptomyces sp. NPDC095817]|uniref:peptidase inhibitor family I36 protein n=1 Tax=Streptomyces sp. NPDC095817 TaxID=3155082 RepID=UPI0033177224
MRNARVLMALASSAAMAMGGLLASAPTASAASCSGAYCVYQHTSFAGAHSTLWGHVEDLSGHSYENQPLISMNDSISSIIVSVSGSDIPVRAYTGKYQGGKVAWFYAGSYSNLSLMGMNDQISSMYW